MTLWTKISDHISSQTSSAFSITDRQSVSGGSINSAYKLIGHNKTYFVKCNSDKQLDMFKAEAAGLNEIAQTNAIKVPQPVCCGVAEQSAYIVLEFIDLRSGNGLAATELGQQLAVMHRQSAPSFGWQYDNTIGSTAQINHHEKNWITFWRDHRLGYQLQLASENGCGQQISKKGDKLLECFPALFGHYKPEPSLLHGDLWSGNYAYDRDGTPVIFDPAVYYGDRETDIAMTELFGGFPQPFYQAYNEAWPLDEGYNVRKTLYNLYHILNHFNLLGGGYLSQSEAMMDKIISECK